AALRAAGLAVPPASWAGIGRASWPARLQRLHGRLAALLPAGFELWLDGGHNPGAGEVLARQAEEWSDRPLYVVAGMKRTKDAGAFLASLMPRAAALFAVREAAQHLALEVAEIVAASSGTAHPGPDMAGALAQVAALPPGRVL
ncbi:glutamate ligase domain-containing protein, partial [Stenotrophomonas sp. A3_2]|uniref:glutamate ligase domain-containing protein n=1 Tax=Stenotrophomonas sp. A3_2 TaxID=3119978 RepID=UPI002FC27F38